MSEEVVPEAAQLRKRRLLIMAAGVGAVFVSLAAWAMLSESSASHHENEPVKLTTAAEVIDEKAVWVNRIESQAKAVQAENQELRQQQQILKKQVDVLEEVFKAQSTLDVQSDVQVQASSQGVAPVQAGAPHTRSVPLQEPQLEDFSQPVDSAPKPQILHLSVNLPHKPKRHLAKYYIPAGSYSRGILTSGVVVSTAQASQANPQPIIIRLISKAMLPRKFRNNIKDAAVVGACYGSLSSERANCRLHKLSLVKRSGVILERDIAGWIIGDDGKPGIKGTVVDRATEVARQALFSGLLSGMAGFLQQQASSSVFPMSPFGQTNALKGGDLAKAGMAQGAGNAFEKLAQFAIKRAEQMQPVLVISSGRTVDIVFKDGVDLQRAAGPVVKLKPLAQQAKSEAIPSTEQVF